MTLTVLDRGCFCTTDTAERLVNLGADLHGHGRLVVDALIPYPKGIKKVIDPDFAFKPMSNIGWTSFEDFKHIREYYLLPPPKPPPLKPPPPPNDAPPPKPLLAC